MPFISLFLILLLSLPLSGQHRLTVARSAMGTPWSITVVTADTLAARRGIEAAFDRVEALEQSMSDYRSDSEINRLVRQPPRQWHRVSPDLYRVLSFSRRLARRSGGAFDPTVGPLSKVWRRAFRQQRFPPDSVIVEARSRVHWKAIRLRRAGQVRFDRPDLQLDLGGVAKGYALDAAGAVLQQAGLTVYLIDGGGDLLLGDPPPGSAGWRVMMPHGPVDTSRVAIATSGSSFRYLELGGRSYSHLIDPRTGLGITDPRSLTVVASSGMAADALASALSVTDPAAAERLARRYRGVSFFWSE